MRKMTAIVTPQEVINNCMAGVRCTLNTRQIPPVADTVLDHFGFVVTASDYGSLLPEFTACLKEPLTLGLTESGAAAGGLQRSGSSADPAGSLSWYYGNPIPGLVLTTQAPGVPAGGGYLALTTPAIARPALVLERARVPFEWVPLYGRQAISVSLRSPDWGVGDGVYRLFIAPYSPVTGVR